jgi:hypothetical protein
VFRPVVAPGKTSPPAQITLHFSADVRLTRTPIAAPAAARLWPANDARVLGQADIYGVYFHGPAYQVLERVLLEENRAIGIMAQDLPPASAPADAEAVVDPLLIELCFQTAGIWLAARRGELALPAEIETVKIHHHTGEANGTRLYAVVTPVKEGVAFDAQVRDEAGTVYVALSGYHTAALPGNVKL